MTDAIHVAGRVYHIIVYHWTAAHAHGQFNSPLLMLTLSLTLTLYLTLTLNLTLTITIRLAICIDTFFLDRIY